MTTLAFRCNLLIELRPASSMGLSPGSLEHAPWEESAHPAPAGALSAPLTTAGRAHAANCGARSRLDGEPTEELAALTVL